MNAEVIKYLDDKGFNNKTICIITGCHQPYVSKVCKGELRQKIQAYPSFSDSQIKRYNIAAELLECKGIFDSMEQAALHIQILRLFGLTSETIYQNYYDFLSKRKFEMLFKQKNLDIKNFHFEIYTTLNYMDFLLLF